MSEHNAVVAIYNTHTEAEAAIKELKGAAFDITKLSIVGKDYHTDERVVGYYNTGDRMKYCARSAHSGVASGGCSWARGSSPSRGSARC